MTIKSQSEIEDKIRELTTSLPGYQPRKGTAFNDNITLQRQQILSRIAALRWVLGVQPETGEVYVDF